MRFAKFFMLASAMALLVVWSANGQPPPDGPKGDKKGDKGFKGGKGEKGFKGGKADSQRLVEDFTMPRDERDKARSILRSYDEKVRQAVSQARRELLDQMQGVLSEADFRQFKDELELVPLLPPIPPNLRTVATDDLVERLMTFAKDGKITKSDLPERMHGLFDRGDTNGDGVLDEQEIKRMAERSSENRPRGPGGPGGPPRGPGGGPPGRPGPPPPPPPE